MFVHKDSDSTKPLIEVAVRFNHICSEDVVRNSEENSKDIKHLLDLQVQVECAGIVD